MTTARRHLEWTRAGRKLALPTGQRVYAALLGQQNIELDDGSYAPYLWSDDARVLRYADVEARFTRDAIEFWRDGVRPAVTRPRLQRRTHRGWVDEETRVRVERLADEDGLRAVACARVALVLESSRATARHILVAGGRHRARGDTSLVAHLPGEYRVLLEHDLGGAPVAPDRSLGAVGHISARGWRVAWTAREDRDRAVRVTERGLVIELPSVQRAVGQRRPAEQWISPDTYGPVFIAAANDDGNSRVSDPGAGEAMYWPNGVPSGYGAIGSLSINDTSGYSDRTVHARFASVDLDGTPTSIDSGTQLYYDRLNIDPGYGSGGSDVVRFRCQATNTPATGSDTSDTSTGRPVLRTYNAAASDHTFAHDDFDDQAVDLTTAIGGLRTAGYSYTGDSTHAIMILAGAAEAWGITQVSYRGIGYDLAHSTRDPAELTIVYTAGGGGGPSEISGASAGTSTATGVLAGTGALTGATAGAATVSGSLTGAGAIAGQAAGVATTAATGTAYRFGAGTSAGTSTASGTLTGSGTLAGASTGTSTAAGALAGSGAVAGAAAGVATAAGALSGSGALSGTSSGASTAAATLVGSGALSGSSAGGATASGEIAGSGALAGTASGTSSATATLASEGAVTGSAAGSATAAGTLSASGALAGTSTGSATASAALAAQGALSGAAGGSTTVDGTLHNATPDGGLTGVAAGSSTATGTLRAVGALTGISSASAATAATLRGSGALSGAVQGIALAAAVLLGVGSISGAGSSAATAAATLRATGALVGSAAGTSTAGGAIEDVTPSGGISGASAGTSTATATLRGTGALAGSSAGASTASATLEAFTLEPFPTGELAVVVLDNDATARVDNNDAGVKLS